MDKRSEPRFQVSALGWVARLGSMDRPCECRVLDVSSDGVRLRTNQHMPVDEVVCLGFHEHVLVVRIRNLRPQGDTFAIGAERICAFPKEEFGEGQPTFERLHELLAEKGWDIEVNTASAVLPHPERARGRWRIALAMSALLLILFAVVLFLKLRTPKLTTPVVPPPATAATPASPPEARPPEPSPAPHHAKIVALQPAWLSASADGKPLPQLTKTYARSDSMEFEFSKIAYVHLGNSRGLSITVDGNAVRLQEPHAVVGVLELTPSGSRFLPWTNGDPTDR